MPTTWVDFKELRARVRIADVLASYRIELRIKGDRASGFCPLPSHNGQRRSPSFSVHLQKNIWKCFGCDRGGNVIDLVAYLEGLDPSNHADIRKAALVMADRFGIQSTEQRVREKREPPPPREQSAVTTSLTPATPHIVLVNAPLDFQLKGLDMSHPYLAARGLNPSTIGCFGLGYCAKGLMAGRIAIPLHDPAGKLIGYAGRIVDDSKINEGHPKYRLPGERIRSDVKHEFHKSLFLYHGHCLVQTVSNLIVVEGFTSTWWLWQAGYSSVVALMGASCSPEQAALIIRHVAPSGHVWIFGDGDEGGERMAVSVFKQVATERATRLLSSATGKQPTDYSPDALAELLPPSLVAERRGK